MRVCVFGAGAIGGHLATRLALGGADVSMVARGSNLEAIRNNGLVTRALDGEHQVTPRVAATAAELGPQDAVVVTVKAPSLTSVAQAITPLLGSETFVVFVMNGIPWWYCDGAGGLLRGQSLPALDPTGALRHNVGISRTVGGVINSACTLASPGVVYAMSNVNKLVLGEPEGRSSPRAEALAAYIGRGGLEALVTPDIRQELWAKLAGGLSNATLCLLSRCDIATTFADPAVHAMAETLIEESLEIAQALGVQVSLDPFAQVAQLATLHHKPSILQDFEIGRPMEIEAMMLAPLRMARMAGVATPMLDVMVALAVQAAGSLAT